MPENTPASVKPPSLSEMAEALADAFADREVHTGYLIDRPPYDGWWVDGSVRPDRTFDLVNEAGDRVYVQFDFTISLDPLSGGPAMTADTPAYPLSGCCGSAERVVRRGGLLCGDFWRVVGTPPLDLMTPTLQASVQAVTGPDQEATDA
jgi:hypothetical protein